MTKELLFESYTKLMEVMYQYAFFGDISFNDFEKLDTDLKLKAIDIIKRKDEVDALISKNLTNYTIDRLNLVDLAIIRISVYELLIGELDPVKVINLGIDLSKEFSDLDDEKQHKFTNRLLDNIYKGLK
ncbi:transcription antitermination protein NusB [Acholeplasma equirhinis]|uniref:transcription antitermination protein NusB n=1 Tax=Acholeplasma equirhinis TaxID=555393 RepID=UPI00197AE961|nr:transcription antitermination protein NusB [Acholeplasma equirhinis]MBN3490207.1 transcription antitermination protein NusB [Acholeplasma equirhinis]